MPSPPPLPPQAEVLALAAGLFASQTVVALAELRLVDALLERPATAEELAPIRGCRPRPLYRLLRAAAGLGLLDEDEARRFSPTVTGATLAADAPGSVRHAVLMQRDHYAAWGALAHSVRTGETAFDHVHGAPLFDWLARHPATAQVFDEAMAGFTGMVAWGLLAVYDFAGFQTLVDVGGGVGALLGAILAAHPGARGVVAEQPQVAAKVAAYAAARGLGERLQGRAADFFRAVPTDGDLYLLKAILHDWDDARAVAILRPIRSAIGDRGAPLLLLERVLPGPGAADRGALGDLNMLVMTGGEERTEPEWRALLDAGGFHLERVTALAPGAGGVAPSLLVARPA